MARKNVPSLFVAQRLLSATPSNSTLSTHAFVHYWGSRLRALKRVAASITASSSAGAVAYISPLVPHKGLHLSRIRSTR
ncbi:hypothetical protein HaLaN_04910 [Haematococcus lacustris]|uniref:Uncharacterized protein n=1 Tax=Haematococcus lacustris TaxID=44745 RepID=A0A699YPL2_HAELA|nr:hypothetical protein HaLaN_04910 [Haematococcus lacustris]